LSKLISVTGLSDLGRVRRRNEDSLALDPARGVAVVADGMGGHPGGDIASRIAANTAASLLAIAGVADASGHFSETFRRVMRDAILRAHTDVRQHVEDQPQLEGMGTTLTAMITSPDGEWVIGHVGDSRAYLFRGGALSQLTRDDTWIQERIDAGDVHSDAAKSSPYAHLLTQCIGLDEPTPAVLTGTAEEGDAYILCSDGLVGMLDDDSIQDILSRGLRRDDNGAGHALTELVAAANAAGGSDNITVAMITYGDARGS
jgi:protein phosphatase